MKRLILSNIGMIIIPIIGFFLIEILLGYFLFVIFEGNPQGNNLKVFLGFRFGLMVIVLIITNGLLTYFVNKSIIIPIKRLSIAAEKISEGDLGYSVKTHKDDELGQLSNTFEEMRLKLKEANEAQKRYEENRKELVASISHDLKTPLTSIKGYVKGVQDGVANTPEKLERYMDTVYKKANHMDGLIDELFLYSKLDLQKIQFHFERVDLYKFFVDVVEDLENSLDHHGAVKFLTPSKENYIVEADREKLKRVVTNITQNSLKYMDRDSSTIQLKLDIEDENVQVAIIDNGNGINRHDLPFIFENFYRTDLSRNSATGGSGLGLSIARKIIEGHGGQIWAESEEGKGTAIYFRLKKVT